MQTRFFLVLFYLLQAVYLFIHFGYFLYFKDIFHSRQILLQFFEGLTIINVLAVPKDLRYLIVLLDLPILLFFLIGFSKFSEFINARYRIINWRRVFFFIAVIFSLPFFSKGIIVPTYAGYQSQEEFAIVERYGLFVNDVLSLLAHKDEKELIKDFNYGQTLAFNNTATAGLKNIICIQVESLDANIIGFNYQGQYVTPFLHQLSSRYIYYPYMLSYAYGAGHSSDVEFAIINGAIPLHYFPSLKLKNYGYPNSFIRRLSRAGFQALAFHNNLGSFFNREEAYLKFGFEKFYDLEKMKLKEYGWGAKDEDVMEYIKNKLKEQKSPFFYYIITMSSHEPFELARQYYENKHYDNIKEILLRNYFNSMSYVDKVLEDFVYFIRNNIGNTYIFIWGDHSPAIQDTPLFRKPVRNRVPLFIITPDNQRYVENRKAVSLLDLAPTILYASGASFEIMSRGVNLLDFPISDNSIAIRDQLTYDRRLLFGDLKGKFN